MKIRIGYGLGTGGSASGADGFASMVDALEANRFDSLWLSERVTGGAVDPIVGLSVAAGRTKKLKLGFSVLVLPGRNPALLAKELASLDHLSNGRLLPAFGLGVADGAEQQAFGVERTERARRFDEALPLLRRLWSEDSVDHDGTFFTYKGLTVRPKPVQSPLEVWLGGRAPSELRRVGRLGDGWLPSFTSPSEAAAGRAVVEEAAAAAGRAVDGEHWGALVIYTRDQELPERLSSLLRTRNPDADPGDIVPAGLPALRAHLERFCEVGFSKFVLVRAGEPGSWEDELGEVASEVLTLQA
ncbi:MAG TPA: TIGR03619 family F420-dependent LLM class oxidoreductase [Acidimicrobiales bacterium]|nr:TIGR03619 family F420-dependent LLM class oxidoreductase [Acidimicrobiales bacterium]